jgi:predicted ATPase/nitrogen-specific signal transduction histidine kinase
MQQSLKKFMSTDSGMNLIDILSFIVKIANKLAGIYSKNKNVNDLTPFNIFMGQTTDELEIADLDTVSNIESINVSIERLVYASPEKLGMFNRQVDFRSNFYSLGIIFYEMLIGQPPVKTRDPNELTSFHIGTVPVPPAKISPLIPNVVSDIVMKLINKSAEDRYQSVSAIVDDLEYCIDQFHNNGIISPFELGKNDIPHTLCISQKLFGRNDDIEVIINCYHQVRRGESKMLLVSGLPGVGKTSVVKEAFKTISSEAFFIFGKYDEIQKDLPYHAIISALNELVNQILTQNESIIRMYKKDLSKALGENAPVLLEIIPNFNNLLEHDSFENCSNTNIGSAEKQNILKKLILDLFKFFCTKDHPIILCLDDLQWIDQASINLIEELLLSSTIHYFLFIGTYRVTEVNDVHPFIVHIRMLKENGVSIKDILLTPLRINDTTDFVVDTFMTENDSVRQLAKIIFNKTEGNPFSIHFFINHLYTTQLIHVKNKCWHFDLYRIQQEELRDHVAEIVAKKFATLSIECQNLLMFASCVGHQFDLCTLSVIANKTPEYICQFFKEAIAAKFIIPFSFKLNCDGLNKKKPAELQLLQWKFSHDIVSRSIISKIPESRKSNIHQIVGMGIATNYPEEIPDDIFFVMVNNLNMVIDHIDRIWLADQNLKAGKKAITKLAFDLSYTYFLTGIRLLSEEPESINSLPKSEIDLLFEMFELNYPMSYLVPDDRKEGCNTHYELLFDLYEGAAEASYLTSKFEESIKFADIIIEKGQEKLSTMNAYDLKIRSFTAQKSFNKAVTTGLEALKLLGMELPENPSKSRLFLSFVKVQIFLAARNLQNLPEMKDKKIQKITSILFSVSNPAYHSHPKLLVLIAFESLLLCFKHGKSTNFIPFTYMLYSVVCCGLLDWIDKGFRFGEEAVQLSEKTESEIKPVIYYYYNLFIRNWKHHSRTINKSFLSIYKNSINKGQIDYAVNSIYIYSISNFYIGVGLDKTNAEMFYYGELAKKYKQDMVLHIHNLHHQIVLNLLEKKTPTTLKGKKYDEDIILQKLELFNDKTGICAHFILKLLLCYMFRKDKEAIDYSIEADKYQHSIIATFFYPILLFYGALVRLRFLSDSNSKHAEKKIFLKKINYSLKKMKKWSHHAPMNFKHKYLLIQAEKNKYLGKNKKAALLYKESIALAKENLYLNDEALATELAANFYDSIENKALATAYIIDAYRLYDQWACKAKMDHLEKHHHEIFAHQSMIIKNKRFDNIAIMKASMLISSETSYDRMIEKLMRIVFSSTNANACTFLTKNKDQKSWERIVRFTNATYSNEPDIRKTLDFQASLEHGVDAEQIKEVIPESIINYVLNTGKYLVIEDAQKNRQFQNDPYIAKNQTKSVFCIPIINENLNFGILYMDNKWFSNVFSEDKVKLISNIATQTAISIKIASEFALFEKQKNELEKEIKREGAITLSNDEINTLQKKYLDISDSINNALWQIKDAIDNFEYEYPEKQNSFKKIKDNINHGYAIIDKFRNFSEINLDISAYVSLRDSIDNVLSFFHLLLKADQIVLTQNLSDNIPQINIYSQKFEIVVFHLLSNARKAVKEKARMSSPLFQMKISISLYIDKAENNVIIEVEDNGSGMTDKVQSKCMEPLFTTRKDTHKGLGLSIVSECIKKNQWDYSIKSNESGTTFRMIIPLKND